MISSTGVAFGLTKPFSCSILYSLEKAEPQRRVKEG